MSYFNDNNDLYYAVQTRNVPLHTQPHYTDTRFNTPQVVFGNPNIEGLHWEYSDRLYEWAYKKSEEAWKKATEDGYVLRSADFYEAYLSAYFDKPIKLYAVMAGVNISNGYPYAIFGFKEE